VIGYSDAGSGVNYAHAMLAQKTYSEIPELSLAKIEPKPECLYLEPLEVIRVLLSEDPEFNFETVVSANGEITVPYVGKLNISGKGPTETAKIIEAALTESLYRVATIRVERTGDREIEIIISGEVSNPDKYQVRSSHGNVSLRDLFTKVGGLTDRSDSSRIKIIRGFGAEVGAYEEEDARIVSLAELQNEGNFSFSVPLQQGDVVFVPGVATGNFLTVGSAREVIVLGEVGRPGVVHFSSNEPFTVFRAILKAGGLRRFADKKRVRVVRHNEDREREEFKINIGLILSDGEIEEDMALKSGDMIIISERIFGF